MFVNHQMIEPDSIERRLYQEAIASSALSRSTLVVLPTGIGKTVIALMVMAETLRTKKGNILFMAPTKPLVEQHARFLKKHLLAEEPVVLTGEIAPAKRKKLWAGSQIICATPQVISNDLISGQIDLKDVSLIVFDEAHRATGDYAYVFIAEKYARVKGGHSLGMTASPGSSKEKILEVCENLGIQGIEIRHDYDPDVVKYVHDVKMRWLEVKVPKEMKKILDFLTGAREEQVIKLQNLGYLKNSKYYSTTDLLAAQREIQANLSRGSENPAHFEAISLVAVTIKLNHALEMAETQGLAALRLFFEKMMKDARTRGASKASKTIIALPKVQLAIKESKSLEIDKLDNPKLKKVVEIVKGQLLAHKHSRIIVFTHFRDTAEMVTKELDKLKGANPARFVGQASKGEDKGMRQKQQVELIDRFKSGEINVLVATSVAEEGLDIPATDMVVFYEPVPSEIRTIQRRGRTGRQRPGKVVVLIYKGTRDEAYRWSSKHKESRMQKELDKLRRELKGVMHVGGPRTGDFSSLAPSDNSSDPAVEPAAGKRTGQGGLELQAMPAEGGRPQRSLMDFEGQQKESKAQKGGESESEPGDELRIKIIVDTREFNSSVVRELARQDFIIESKQLDIGDYIVSDRVGIERKEVDDFIHSLKDGRLFPQVKALKRAYLAPMVIVEGENLYSRSGMAKSAIMGALASITVDFGIPVITVKDEVETAELVGTIARREFMESRTPAMRSDKGTMLLQERQQFIIEGLPNVSAVLAQRLLSYFGSAQAIMDADVKELMKVKGIGKGIAQGIRDVLDAKYYSKERKDS
ncbi:MAG: DEAD/DEAH box helicase [Thermoplasmata archaeon]|nr:DEAD/DEAH box helicase [Thermoplasmata archaeon]